MGRANQSSEGVQGWSGTENRDHEGKGEKESGMRNLSGLEGVVARVWEDVLGLPKNLISYNSDFVAMGGLLGYDLRGFACKILFCVRACACVRVCIWLMLLVIVIKRERRREKEIPDRGTVFLSFCRWGFAGCASYLQAHASVEGVG